ncbi:DUF6339 family protein [Gordonia terrae]|uniref:DUF6339 family protein n=1 Tax=Gordonia terrae TaxID=2055 RepID=UPI00200A443C|nr:DUF6339 family protein [Gordonia terrae]UPW11566.1 DUF6339 family protein [Gordonia terrae]
MTELWPRLAMGLAVAEYRGLPSNIRELAANARNSHPQVTYAATGGVRVTEARVADLAEAVRVVAVEYGFPEAAGPADLVRFDRAAAEAVHSAMSINPVEAGVRGVWNFLSLIAMPDVTRWRFQGDNIERWVATDLTRHMFARLWWQARTFAVITPAGATDYSLLRGMSESDLNQIMERRSIAGVAPLARSIARVLAQDPQAGSRRKILRDATPRLRRLMSFIDFSALDDSQLDDRVRAVLHETRLAG